MKKNIPLLAATAIAALALSGCVSAAPQPLAQDTESTGVANLPAAIVSAGVLKVAVAPDFPPLEYTDPETDEIVGMDVDLMDRLGEVLGIKIERVSSPFDQLINSVQTGRVDMVMSGLSDTIERQETLDFVDYYQSAGRLYALADRAGEFKQMEDMCGSTLTVSGKTDYFEQVKKISEEVCVGAGKPAIDILPTDGSAAAQLQLEQGRADLSVMGAEYFSYIQETNPGKFEGVFKALTAQPFAAAVKKGNTELAEALLAGFKAMVEDGSYLEILSEYGLSDGATTPAINGVKKK